MQANPLSIEGLNIKWWCGLAFTELRIHFNCQFADVQHLPFIFAGIFRNVNSVNRHGHRGAKSPHAPRWIVNSKDKLIFAGFDAVNAKRSVRLELNKVLVQGLEIRSALA